ncbi:MAG: carbonic anhydrase [Euryarchaeota archaeon]|nr:carbonic anhydrase [Euryarchaeota archaeon]
MTPEDALKTLMEGNARFVSCSLLQRDHAKARRATSASQSPHSVVVCCSDSRSPPELIFDQGIGDIFVVRSIGCALDELGLGSVQYALQKLGARLVLVLGHTGCGAVELALREANSQGPLASVVSKIHCAVGEGCVPGDAVARQTRATVCEIMALAKALRIEGVRALGAVYNLDSGRVHLMKRRL